MRVALIQPEIPQNVGSILRLAACFDVPVDLVGPTGFVLSDARLRRAGMDYLDLAVLTKHRDWSSFQEDVPGRRVLLTTHGDQSPYRFQFTPGDVLMFGSESAGAAPEVHAAAAARLRLPMRQHARSLNLALAAAMTLGEALRQTGALPKEEERE